MVETDIKYKLELDIGYFTKNLDTVQQRLQILGKDVTKALVPVNAGFRDISPAIKETENRTNSLQKGFNTFTSVLKSAQGALLGFGLSLLFTGILIQRFFDRIIRGATETYLKISEGATPAAQGIVGVGAAFEFLKYTIGAAIAEALLPFIPLILDIVDAIAEWIDQNPALAAGLLLAGLALGFLFFIAGQALTAFAGLIGVFGLAARLAMLLETETGLLSAALSGLVDVFAGLTLESVLTALAELGFWFLVILAGVLILKAAWDSNFLGMKDTVKKIFGVIKTTIKAILDDIVATFGIVFKNDIPDILKDFGGIFKELFKGNFDVSFDYAVKFAVDLITLFTRLINLLLRIVIKLAVGMFEIFQRMNSFLLKIMVATTLGIPVLFAYAVAKIISIFGDLILHSREIFIELGVLIVKVLEGAINLVADAFNSIIGGINTIIDALPQEIKTQLGINGDIGTIGHVNLAESARNTLEALVKEDPLKNQIGQALKDFGDFATNAVEGIAKSGLNLVNTIFDGLDNAIIGTVKGLGNFVESLIPTNEALDNAKKKLTELLTGFDERDKEVQTNAEALVNLIKNTFPGLTNPSQTSGTMPAGTVVLDDYTASLIGTPLAINAESVDKNTSAILDFSNVMSELKTTLAQNQSDFLNQAALGNTGASGGIGQVNIGDITINYEGKETLKEDLDTVSQSTVNKIFDLMQQKFREQGVVNV